VTGRRARTAALIIGLVGLSVIAGLTTYLTINNNSPEATPVSYVPGNPEALPRATLHLSDFPRFAEYSAGWTAKDLVDRTVLGSIGIANAFTRCLRVRSALLGGFGPASASTSPIFTSGFNTVENLVAVEPSVARAVDVMDEIDRMRSSSCVVHQLERGWRQLNRASSTETNLVVTTASNDLPQLGNRSTSFSFFFSNRPHKHRICRRRHRHHKTGDEGCHAGLHRLACAHSPKVRTTSR
jgi:hypothetical protein